MRFVYVLLFFSLFVFRMIQSGLENPVSSERSDDIIIPFTNSELSHQHMCIILVNIYSFINLFFLCCRKFVSYVQAISIYCIADCGGLVWLLYLAQAHPGKNPQKDYSYSACLF